MMHALLFALALSAPAPATVPTPAPVPPPVREASPEDRYSTIAYDPTEDAASELEFRLKGTAISGKKLLIIMGGNWCHDSAALANLIDSPRFVGMITQKYEVLFIDVGVPQTGRGRNLDIAKRFGIKKIKGTPTVLVVSPEGKLLNSKKDAASWRNAASRNEDAIYRYFAEFTPA
ncbi:thioredoxin family protein [uncultured Sphingorhabdus sp.]|uniref:thioredoxin family protein n=1 Tax=uncultured Sphingorhabdus sp. TaxID=1686106 RepID=UPI002605B923|nr:thioredoxin family protein [uncultured Sphingorhabdus sp.]HMS19409.1 thioredoxin family protein [Sphingorhabdus sp.]